MSNRFSPDNLYNCIVPQPLQRMIELNERMARLADPLGLSHLHLHNVVGNLPLVPDNRLFEIGLNAVQLAGATELHGSLSRTAQLFDGQIKMLNAGPLADLMKAGEPWGEMTKLVRNLGAVNGVTQQFSRMASFNAGLQNVFGAATLDNWSAHLKNLVIPSMSFLAHEWAIPVGLMAELPDSNLGASVSWLVPYRDHPVVMTAALTRESEGGTEVIVEGDPVCAICGGPLISLGSSVRWTGPKRGIRRRHVFPACSKCFILEAESPGTLVQALEALSRPALRVMTSQRTGDGVPQAVLRLVSDDEHTE